ncbi:MAG: Do family serine endopeptidase [Alphaproteobacteria bacterium]
MVNSLRFGVRRVGVPVAAALVLFGAAGTAHSQAIGPDFADMVEQVLPAVVHVSVETRQSGVFSPFRGGPGGTPNPFGFDPFGPFGPGGPRSDDQRERPPAVMGSGSGFIIDPQGYVVTNNHVIQGADILSITLADGDVYEATVVGTDPSTDLALLKIDSDEDFPSVTWGDSDGLRIGNWVVAVGGPFGLSGTVTAGIVSATGRDLHSGPYDDYIQFDAQINPGNSGGPVFNTRGEVVGVSTAIVSPSRGSVGIGFAVPAAIARPVIASLMVDGVVERGFIGVQIQQVTDQLAEALGLDSPTGALVAEVRPGTPAEQAGVQVGDLIVTFDGQTVNRMRDLPRIVGMTEPGAEVPMEVLREGETITLAVTVGQTESSTQQSSAAPSQGSDAVAQLGLAVAPAADFGWEGANGEMTGLVITDITPGSSAAGSGLRVGDVILAIGGRKVETPEQMAEIVAAQAGDDDAMIALLVEREGTRRFIALPIEAS